MDGFRELISVIVSVYNVEDYLQDCLQSLIVQSYSNIEILLIDDGSTDSSGAICEEFAQRDSRIKVIHQENQGLWAVRNRGVKESHGEYLVFPDGDDYFHKDYLRLLFNAINWRGRDYPVAFCNYVRVKEKDGEDLTTFNPSFIDMTSLEFLGKLLNNQTSRGVIWGACWNKLYRRRALPEPFNREFYRCQDYDANIRFFFKADRACFVDCPLYYWRARLNQLTQASNDAIIRNESRSQILYDSLKALPDSLSLFRSHLLLTLYTRMAIWRSVLQSVSKREAEKGISTIRSIERDTLWGFLLCRQGTLFHRLHLVALLHFSPIFIFLKRQRTRLVGIRRRR